MNSGTDHQGMLTRRRIRQLLEDGIEVNLEAMDFINKDRQNGRNAQAKSKSKSLCSEPTHRAEDLQDHSYFENGNVRDSAGLNRNNQNKHSENFVDFRNEDDLLEGEDVVLDDVDQNELLGESDVGKAENQFNRGETFERVPFQQVDLVRGPLHQFSTFNRLEAALILDKIPDIDGREGSDKIRAFFRRFDLGTEEWTDAQRIRALQSKVEGKAERALNAALDSEEINSFGSQSLYAPNNYGSAHQNFERQSQNYYRNDQNRALRIQQPIENQNVRAALQWQENRNCYICGRPGHIATYCRERNPGTSNQANNWRNSGDTQGPNRQNKYLAITHNSSNQNRNYFGNNSNSNYQNRANTPNNNHRRAAQCVRLNEIVSEEIEKEKVASGKENAHKEIMRWINGIQGKREDENISLHVSTAPFGSNVIVGTNALGALGFKMFDESNLTKIDFEQLDENEEEITQVRAVFKTVLAPRSTTLVPVEISGKCLTGKEAILSSSEKENSEFHIEPGVISSAQATSTVPITNKLSIPLELSKGENIGKLEVVNEVIEAENTLKLGNTAFVRALNLSSNEIHDRRNQIEHEAKQAIKSIDGERDEEDSSIIDWTKACQGEGHEECSPLELSELDPVLGRQTSLGTKIAKTPLQALLTTFILRQFSSSTAARRLTQTIIEGEPKEEFIMFIGGKGDLIPKDIFPKEEDLKNALEAWVRNCNYSFQLLQQSGFSPIHTKIPIMPFTTQQQVEQKAWCDLFTLANWILEEVRAKIIHRKQLITFPRGDSW
uniref:CCHC-type domain-containing protein n=1 Tax=Meloidogyne javanica TaxID=6303 RepID=A0A915LT44_MELJA